MYFSISVDASPGQYIGQAITEAVTIRDAIKTAGHSIEKFRLTFNNKVIEVDNYSRDKISIDVDNSFAE